MGTIRTVSAITQPVVEQKLLRGRSWHSQHDVVRQKQDGSPRSSFNS